MGSILNHRVLFAHKGDSTGMVEPGVPGVPKFLQKPGLGLFLPSAVPEFIVDNLISTVLYSCFLFLTEEAYSHGGLLTGKLGQTPLSVDQPKSEH